MSDSQTWRDHPDARALLAFLAINARADGFKLECVKLDGVVVAGRDTPPPVDVATFSAETILSICKWNSAKPKPFKRNSKK
jgi:hypothetical protein